MGRLFSKPYALLGYSGALPFILSVLAPHLSTLSVEFSQTLLFNYGAVILSFVGALYWGFAMQTAELTSEARTRLYVLSVLPALIAWMALSIGCPPITAALLMAGFAGQWCLDRRVSHCLDLPSWYMQLRTHLTVVALISLAFGGFW